MALPPLLSIAGAAAGAVATRAVERLSDGLPFSEIFGSRSGSAPPPGSSNSSSQPAGANNLPPKGDSGMPGLDSVRRQAAALLQQFRELFQDRLSGSNADPSHPVTLTSDAQGQIRVAGTHPDRGQIERHLAEDPELADLFHQLAAHFRLLRRAEDPQATGSGNFQLTMHADRTEADFAE